MKALLQFTFYYLFLLYFPLQVHAQNWIPQAEGLLPVNYGVYSISVVNENVVWAVAWDLTSPRPVPLDHITKVLKTTDGGDTWNVYDMDGPAAGRISFDIFGMDENTAFVTLQTYNNELHRGLWKTEDGGTTWTEVFANHAAGVWVRFFNNAEGIVINRHRMYTTADGGVTWQQVPAENIPPFIEGESTIITTGSNSLHVVGDHLWFGTDKGRVFYSADKGYTWSVSSTDLGTNAKVATGAFKSTTEGIVINVFASTDNFSKTTDGGVTWTKFTSNQQMYIRSVYHVPGTEGALVGTSHVLSPPVSAFSRDFGHTWTYLDNPIAFRAPQFLNPTTGWAGCEITSTNQAAILKWDGTDIFSCNPATAGFSNPVLTHTGPGSSEVEYIFSPGSKTPSFTISGLDAKLNGAPHNRYVEEVTVSYVDLEGNLITYCISDGNTTSSVPVEIPTYVQSVKVSLKDIYDGDYGGNLQVHLSDINYCDDNASCMVSSGSFDTNPLTHQGPGSVSTTLLLGGNTDVQFTVSALDFITYANPASRFIDQVTVTYDDGTDPAVLYGVFSAEEQSAFTVNIPGPVQSVTVSLEDGYDGNYEAGVLSVSLSDVTSCAPPPAAVAAPTGSQAPAGQMPEFQRPDAGISPDHITVYPNPFHDELYIRFETVPQDAEVTLFNLLGTQLARYQATGEQVMRLALDERAKNSSVLFVEIRESGKSSVVKKVFSSR